MRRGAQRVSNTLEKDRNIREGRTRIPGADAWTGVAPEKIRATRRSVSAARVRVSERRILAKTDSEVRLQLPQIEAKVVDGRLVVMGPSVAPLEL